MSEEYPPTLSITALRSAVSAVFRHAGFTVETVSDESSSLIDFVTLPASGGGSGLRHCVVCVDDSKEFGEQQVEEIFAEAKRLEYSVIEVISSRRFEDVVRERAQAKGIRLTDGEKLREVLQGFSEKKLPKPSGETRKVTALPPARIVSRRRPSGFVIPARADSAVSIAQEDLHSSREEPVLPEMKSASSAESLSIEEENSESAFAELDSMDPAEIDVPSGEAMGSDDERGAGDFFPEVKESEDNENLLLINEHESNDGPVDEFEPLSGSNENLSLNLKLDEESEEDPTSAVEDLPEKEEAVANVGDVSVEEDSGEEAFPAMDLPPGGKQHPPRWEFSPVKAAKIDFESEGEYSSREEGVPMEESGLESSPPLSEELNNSSDEEVEANQVRTEISPETRPSDLVPEVAAPGGKSSESIKRSMIVDLTETSVGEEEDWNQSEEAIGSTGSEESSDYVTDSRIEPCFDEADGNTVSPAFSHAHEQAEETNDVPPPFPENFEENGEEHPDPFKRPVESESDAIVVPVPSEEPEGLTRSKSKLLPVLLSVCGVIVLGLFGLKILSASLIEKFNAYFEAEASETAGVVENLSFQPVNSQSGVTNAFPGGVEGGVIPTELVSLTISKDAMINADQYKEARNHVRKIWGIDAETDPDFLKFFNDLSLHVVEGIPIDLEQPINASIMVRLENQPHAHPGLAAAKILYLLEGEKALTEFSKVIDYVRDPVLRFQLFSKMAAYTYSKDDVRMAVSSLKAMLDETDGLASVDDSIQVKLLLEGPASALMEEVHETWAAVIAGDGKTQPWLKDLVVGRHHFLAALEGGDGENQLSLATEAFERSWEANPRNPAAAAMAIEVSKSKSLEDARLWFDRAVTSRADYLPAYQNYMDCLSRRALGSDAHVAAFGKACLETGRFDTDIPEQLLNAHFTRAEVAGSKRSYWANLSDDEEKELAAFFTGERKRETSPAKALDSRSREAAIWYLCGEMKKVLKVLTENKFAITQSSIQNLPVGKGEILTAAVEFAKQEPDLTEEEETELPVDVVVVPEKVPESEPEEVVLVSAPLLPEEGGNFTNELGNNMIWVSPGEFVRTASGASSLPLTQKIAFSRGFWMADTEVTRAHWNEVMPDAARPGTTPENGDQPVDSISWEEAKEFCRVLSSRDRDKLPKGWRYDLPSEAQWDYAADRGEKTFYDEALAWTEANSKNALRTVGSKGPNEWGFYDLIGNAAEWVQDHYVVYDSDFPLEDPVIELTDKSTHRSVRGGSVAPYDRRFGINHRDHHDPNSRRKFLGFRIALIPSNDGASADKFNRLTSADPAEEEAEVIAQ